MDGTRKFQGPGPKSDKAPQYDGVITNFKNADIYEVKFQDGNTPFMFKNDQVRLSFIPYDAQGNARVSAGVKVKFQPLQDIYFKIGIDNKPVQVTKQEADKIQAAATAAVLNEAAKTTLKKEEVKKTNINKTGLIVGGIILFVGTIATIAYMSRGKKQTA